MKITDLLKPQAIDLSSPSCNKEEAVSRLVDLMVASGKISDQKKISRSSFCQRGDGKHWNRRRSGDSACQNRCC